MRRLCSVLMVLGLILGAPPRASAELGAIDVVPAATLLIPYFEVGLDPDFTDRDTRLSIRNTSAAPVLTHFTVYSDVGVPTLFFDVVLTGYDVHNISLRDLFDGNVVNLGVDTAIETPGSPETETALFQDNFETGDLSQWSVVESRVSKQGLAAYHTGAQNDRTGLFAGSDQGDGIARGYITIDNVNSFNAGFPTEAGYFVSGGMGVASNDNVLTGEFEWVYVADNAAVARPMVHVEAGSTAEVTTAGKYTFYGAYVDSTAADNREPLASTWRNRYVNGGVFETTLIYWHDTKFPVSPFASPNTVDFIALPHGGIVMFDEEENSVERPFINGVLPSPIPLVCGRATLGAEGFNSPFNFGWVLTDLNGVLGPFGELTQGFMMSEYSASGRFAIDVPGVPSGSLLGLP